MAMRDVGLSPCVLATAAANKDFLSCSRLQEACKINPSFLPSLSLSLFLSLSLSLSFSLYLLFSPSRSLSFCLSVSLARSLVTPAGPF